MGVDWQRNAIVCRPLFALKTLQDAIVWLDGVMNQVRCTKWWCTKQLQDVILTNISKGVGQIVDVLNPVDNPDEESYEAMIVQVDALDPRRRFF